VKKLKKFKKVEFKESRFKLIDLTLPKSSLKVMQLNNLYATVIIPLIDSLAIDTKDKQFSSVEEKVEFFDLMNFDLKRHYIKQALYLLMFDYNNDDAITFICSLFENDKNGIPLTKNHILANELLEILEIITDLFFINENLIEAALYSFKSKNQIPNFSIYFSKEDFEKNVGFYQQLTDSVL
jgi:hypothetical protein